MADDRLISLNAAIDALWHSIECENGGELQSYAEAVVGDAEDVLKALPIVDAVPVRHGRWIYHPDWQADGECGYECSECGMGSDVDYPYCMLCGARMDGKDGDNG